MILVFLFLQLTATFTDSIDISAYAIFSSNAVKANENFIVLAVSEPFYLTVSEQKLGIKKAWESNYFENIRAMANAGFFPSLFVLAPAFDLYFSFQLST